jgi:hypothetical protein
VLCPLVPATQHGAGCGVLFVKESGAGGRWSRVRWEQRALRTPSPLLLRRERVRWGVAMAVGSAPEAMEERVPRQLRKLPSVTGFCTTFYLTPRLPRGWPSYPSRSLLHAAERGVVRHRHPVGGERCASPGEY